jgi:hypothetical protein
MKREYLIQEFPEAYGFSVMVCEDDRIIARRSFTSLSSLLLDAARFHIADRKARVALETRGGLIVELNKSYVKPFNPYEGLTKEQRDEAHFQQVQQMMRDGA